MAFRQLPISTLNVAFRRCPCNFLPGATEDPTEEMRLTISSWRDRSDPPLAVSHAAAGVFSLHHHGVLHELLLAGEDPAQRQTLVGQCVHQCGVGVSQQGLEQPAMRVRHGPSW